jgi:fibro-slime domain-containing protein
MLLRLLVGQVLLLSVVVPVMTQENDTKIIPKYVQTYKIPVTYFDYHVDGSNPDFGGPVTDRWNQTGLPNANAHGWVDSVLTVDKSPRRSPALTNKYLDISWNLEKLFKPWVHGGLDTFACKNPDTLIVSDTLFKNIVIEDSLKASWVDNTFTGDDTTDSVWVFGSFTKMNPLKGKGFGGEGHVTSDHPPQPDNTGYTMRLHNQFNYHGGEKIYFGGNDDLYLFVNGKLAIECGGFHSFDSATQPVVLDLDTLGLTICWVYDIDVFFVERKDGGNFVLAGFNPLENKGEDKIDTLYDTVPIAGIIPHSQKSKLKKGSLLGLSIPASSQNVKLEYFSLSGAKLGCREISLTQALVDQSINLSREMNMVRVTFLNAQGRPLSTGFYRKMILRK